MRKPLIGGLALVCLILAAGRSDPPPPALSVSEGMLMVENQTDHDWEDVLITVNDHYRGYVPVLKAAGRADAPVSQLTTGNGQRWIQGTRVKTIDVTGTRADGTVVTLTWGRDDTPGQK